MALLSTDAIVLHVADYLESSRILRLATREAGVLSVVARGARSSKKRFGSAVDLFAVGQAQIDVRPTRDLHALTGFDVVRSQAALAADLARFGAAAALAECALRVVHDEAAQTVYDGLVDGFQALELSTTSHAVQHGLGALWRLVRDVGFAPVLEQCAECHGDIEIGADAAFSHASGGVLCHRCAMRTPGGRRLPYSARLAILGWLENKTVELDHQEKRAHQRLFREFLEQHLADRRPPRAFLSWEAGTLDEVRG